MIFRHYFPFDDGFVDIATPDELPLKEQIRLACEEADRLTLLRRQQLEATTVQEETDKPRRETR